MNSPHMRNVFLILTGVIVCIALQVGFGIFQGFAQPQGKLTNIDCPSIEVASTTNKPGQTYLIRKGETRAIPNGEYNVTLDEGKGSFLLYENNQGICKILWESSSTFPQGYFDVAVNPNASVSRLSENGSVSGL